jgi:AAA ATPase-like protein
MAFVHRDIDDAYDTADEYLRRRKEGRAQGALRGSIVRSPRGVRIVWQKAPAVPRHLAPPVYVLRKPEHQPLEVVIVEFGDRTEGPAQPAEPAPGLPYRAEQTRESGQLGLVKPDQQVLDEAESRRVRSSRHRTCVRSKLPTVPVEGVPLGALGTQRSKASAEAVVELRDEVMGERGLVTLGQICQLDSYDQPLPTMSARNPFQPAPGASPPALVGREAELAAISDAVDRVARSSAPTPIAFLGLRGLGKTVLLNAIRARTPDGLHLRIEVEPGVALATLVRQSLGELQSSVEPLPRRFGKALDRAMRHIPLPSLELPHDLGAIKLSAASEEQPEALPVGQAINVLNEAVAGARKYLVITIDEVQDVDIAGLRSIVARVHQSAGTSSPILFACAGLPQAYVTFKALRTYATRWDRFELDFLTRAETAEAIRIPLREERIAIEDRALDMLVDASAGYPFFVQKYASAAWNHHRGHSVTVDDAAGTIPAVRALVEKTFYADEFRRLSPRERLFVKALAQLGPGPQDIGAVAQELGAASSAAIGSLRTNLLKKGIVYVPSAGAVQFRMPLAERYILEHLDMFSDSRVTRYQQGLSREVDDPSGPAEQAESSSRTSSDDGGS